MPQLGKGGVFNKRLRHFDGCRISSPSVSPLGMAVRRRRVHRTPLPRSTKVDLYHSIDGHEIQVAGIATHNLVQAYS